MPRMPHPPGVAQDDAPVVPARKSDTVSGSLAGTVQGEETADRMTGTGADIAKTLHRMALLYRCFAETLETELGLEEATRLTKQAVIAYGTQIGREALARTLATGKEPLPENFSDDLPAGGWVTVAEERDGEPVTRVDVCPLADEWKSMRPELARLYCFVDQAKMEAFNPAYTYAHLSNKLDGDPVCLLAVRKRTDG